MKTEPWILLDTETTGFTTPVFVVELAAQRMVGWEPQGKPFRKLLNQNQEIPSEVSRVHGYTREILERDGDPAHQVYREFADYAGDLPLVSFNLVYDLDQVLKPEWKRLRITPVGSRGFCALRLAQRLLDPVPAGNCKLQTLRQYYRLPERGAHTALGDVQTVADLMAQVLRPIAEYRGLDTWGKLVEFTTDEWFPSRITFGKYKGRLIQEARKDMELRHWLDWLADSSNARSRKIGLWYLRQLEIASVQPDTTVFAAPEIERGSKHGDAGQTTHVGLIIYVNPELEQLRQLVAGARARLVEFEVSFTKEKSRVDVMQAVLFRQLREHYQKRDRLRLIVDYRQKFLDSLIRGGDDDAKRAAEGYEQAKIQIDKDYDETAAAVAEKKQLTAEEEMELSRLWKKLVKLYHPDRFANQPDKLETYHRLTAAINRAKDSGDIKTLKEIAEDPHGFILRQGWGTLDFSDEMELVQLRRLNETLQLEIIAVIESLNSLKESPDYELCQLSDQNPAMLDELAAERAKLLNQENVALEKQAGELAKEIAELSGMLPGRII
jgi:DNA polymerase-3 subunit epsilon